MKIEYINNSDDIVNFSFLKLLNSSYYKKKINRSRYIILIAFLFVFIFEYFAFGLGLGYYIINVVYKGDIIYIIIVAEIIIWLLFPKLYSKLLKFSLTEKCNKKFNRNATMIIDENGIIDKSEDISYELSWSDIEKVIVTDKYIYFYLEHGNSLMIPVDTFNNSNDKEEFLQIISENICGSFDKYADQLIKPKFNLKKFFKRLLLTMCVTLLIVLIALGGNELLTHKNNLIIRKDFALYSEYNKVSDNIPKVQNILKKFPQLKIYITNGLNEKVNDPEETKKFGDIAGLYRDDTIYISGLNNDSDTLFHELGHAINAYIGCYLEVGYAVDNTRDRLSLNDDFKKLYEKYKTTSIFTEYGRNPSSDTRRCLSEGFAEMFANYTMDRSKVDKEVASYFDNIVKTITNLKSEAIPQFK